MLKFTSVLTGLGASILCSTLAHAADTTATTPVKTDDRTVMVCVEEPAPTGSHLGAHKTCMTKAEWDAMHAASRDALDQNNRKSLQGNMSGGGG